MDIFTRCPLAANLRISAGQSLDDYESLGACSQRIIVALPVALPPDPSVARITGVKAQPERRGARGDDAQAPARRTSQRAVPLGTRPYDAEIVSAAASYRIDPLFLHAIVATESNYNPAAVSRADARGLMQILPTTGSTLGIDRGALFDPRANVDAGARLLKRLQGRYGRNFELILGAYNAGEGAVARYGNRVPPYRETQLYVGKVMGHYRALRAAQGTGE